MRYDFEGLIHGGAYFRNFTVLEVAHETASNLYEGYPAHRGDIFSFLPGLTVFSQLLNVREINIFPAKLNLESKLRLPHYFHLGNKVVHIAK